MGTMVFKQEGQMVQNAIINSLGYWQYDFMSHCVKIVPNAVLKCASRIFGCYYYFLQRKKSFGEFLNYYS